MRYLQSLDCPVIYLSSIPDHTPWVGALVHCWVR